MLKKRVTIYDIAQALGMSASYVSRALNDHPAVSKKVRDTVKAKADDLNYKHDTRAANLRQGLSRTIGVVVPHITETVFADAIAGIENTCAANNYTLIIAQSHDSFEQERMAVAKLIHQNVDCILISVAATTHAVHHLQEIKDHGIELIQFDRCLDTIDSHTVSNNNQEVTYAVTMLLKNEGYKQIAFIGGPAQLTAYKERKAGYLAALKDSGIIVPYHFVIENALSKQKVTHTVQELLSLTCPPDAFITVSDKQALSILETVNTFQNDGRQQIGVFGFSNEYFAAIVNPGISSVDQKSNELGKRAAGLYFRSIQNRAEVNYIHEIVSCEIQVRQSSIRSINR